MVAQIGEIVAIAEIPPARLRRERIEDDVAGLVEDEHRAHVLGGGGAVEQHQIARLGRHRPERGKLQPLDRRLQREVVDRDVALDVLIEGDGKVLRGPHRLLPDEAMGVPQHPGGERADAGRDRHAAGQQQRDRAAHRRSALIRQNVPARQDLLSPFADEAADPRPGAGGEIGD